MIRDFIGYGSKPETYVSILIFVKVHFLTRKTTFYAGSCKNIGSRNHFVDQKNTETRDRLNTSFNSPSYINTWLKNTHNE